MFAPFRNPTQAYRQLGTETAVSDANPHRLIDMLFEGASEFIAKADAAIVRRDLATKGESITRAIRIVDEGLNAALDMSAGEVAENLRSLYLFVELQLLAASRDNDRERLAVARRTLAEIHAAWRQIAPARNSQPDFETA
ncbi:MAG: flagellar export chaperone FliS [Burkholderiaceae bacterium]